MATERGTEAEQRSRAEIADRLRREIESGAYPAGSKLPSYRQLASTFGAAPNTVGEAMRLLASEGRVVIRPQAGAVVVDSSDVVVSAEARLAAARSELVVLREELRSIRQAVDQIDGRVAELISRLPVS